MVSFMRVLVSCFMLFFLSACQKPTLTYAYLMQHPLFLQEKVSECHANASTSDDCRLIMSAANDFAALLNEQQQDPEKFGQRLLAEQITCAKDPKDKNCEDIKTWLAVVGVNTPE